VRSKTVKVGSATLILGDCLDCLAELEAETIAAVITDPPYCSGARTAAAMPGRAGMVRGRKFFDTLLPNDRMTSIGFTWLLRQVGLESARLLVPGGSFLTFIDWRQYPVAYAALETTNLRLQAMVVWDKLVYGLGNGFRNQHELILHAANGVPKIFDRATPNVLRCARLAGSELHPAEKPVDLIKRLIAVVSAPGSIVLDPFMLGWTAPYGIECARL